MFRNLFGRELPPIPKSKVISFLNQKGGVGKTTMAFNLAHALAHSGRKVLCIDMDPQANLSMLFGIDSYERDHNIYHLLMNSIRDLRDYHSPVMTNEIIERIESSGVWIDIIPGGQELSGFDLSIANADVQKQLVLKEFIDKNLLNEHYDAIVIDGPPTLGLIVVNILCATTGVLIPFQADQFSRKGLTHFQRVLTDISEMGLVQAPEVIGYIPNLIETRRKQACIDFESIKEDLSEETVFDVFSNRVQLAKCSAIGKSVFDYRALEFKELQKQFRTMVDHIEGMQ